jgi:putative nucleotidyltransferase with HDIG domain
MKPAVPQESIDVQALRVGMFVYLDLGWLAHPFPLSNFRIESAQQIDTIRSLGVKRVRWSPRYSTLDGQAALEDSSDISPLPDAAPIDAEPAAAVQAPVESPEVRARAERRRRHAAQRASLALCEKQYGEAARDLRRVNELVCDRPVQARETAEALTRALVGKMVGAGELCIRLLSDGVGDKASLHPLNVTVVSLLMGRALGWPEAEMVELGVGAMLHDVGKIELPERVRHRGEHFSPSEQRAYEEHVARGVVMAQQMGLSASATLVIAQHHEHADGSGFPQHIGTERMTPAARVVALVNRYDKMCNPPLGVRSLTPHEALSLLFAQHRGRFDSAILGAFIKMMGVYPPGSTVQLTDDRYAMVMGVNSSRPLKPRVLVHEAGLPAGEALIVDLETEPNLGIRRSMNPLNLPSASLQYLSPRQRISYFFESARETEATV